MPDTAGHGLLLAIFSGSPTAVSHWLDVDIRDDPAAMSLSAWADSV